MPVAKDVRLLRGSRGDSQVLEKRRSRRGRRLRQVNDPKLLLRDPAELADRQLPPVDCPVRDREQRDDGNAEPCEGKRDLRLDRPQLQHV